MSAPAALVAVPLLAGSATAIIFVSTVDPSFAALAAGASLLALVAATGAAAIHDRVIATIAILIGTLSAGLSLGASAARSAYAPPLLQWFDRTMPSEPVWMEGVLREDASVTPQGVSLTIDVTSVGAFTAASRVIGGVRASVGGALSAVRVEEWRAGRTVRAPASLRRPSTYLNPGTPDERPPLARRGIVLVGTIKSAALVDVVRHGTLVNEAAAAIRGSIRRRIDHTLQPLDPKTAGVATAVLIGDRSGLAEDDERRLQEAGTYHVIAISGGNIAIIAVLIVLLCRVGLIPPRAAAIATATVLLFYGAIAGGAASVSRAITVAILVLIARAMDQRGAALNALAVAAVLAAAWSPVVVLDPGFILSFGATLGILAGVPRLANGQSRATSGMLQRVFFPIRTAVRASVAATVCAEVALGPVSAALFGRLPLAGVILNIAAIPLMTVVQVCGLVLIVPLGLWGPIATIGARTAHWAATGLLQSATVVDLAPWLALDVRPPAPWIIALYYCAALGLFLRRTRRAALALLVSSAAVIVVGPDAAARDAVPSPPSGRVRVVILDVGQGDATAVVLPGGRTLLIDAGGVASFAASQDPFETAPAFDVGARVVVPALRALGVRRLQALVLTHGDPDHIVGAPGLLRHIPAASIWEGVPVPPLLSLQAIASHVGRAGVPWRTVQAGDRERFGEVDVRVLHPPLPDWERQRVRNDDSIVLEVRLGHVSIILPGDIGREGEQAILPRLEPDRLVILKAPHHGSATSSTQPLLDALRPAAVIFSCGRDNRFGHPHPAIVERYHAIGAAMFSTAEDGAVFVETDGAKVEVWGWRGRRAEFNALR
jgi:competence protein ComEC